MRAAQQGDFAAAIATFEGARDAGLDTAALIPTWALPTISAGATPMPRMPSKRPSSAARDWYTGVSVEQRESNLTRFDYTRETIEIDLDDPKSIDRLKHEHGNSELLLQDQDVPAGEYDWIRPGVNAGPNKTLVEVDSGDNALDVPHGQNTGLKLISGSASAMAAASTSPSISIFATWTPLRSRCWRLSP